MVDASGFEQSRLHPSLQAAARTLEIKLPNLENAARLTHQKVQQAQQVLRDELGHRIRKDAELDVVAVGSMARAEMSKGSDFDYLILAHGIGDDPGQILDYRRAAEKARRALKADAPGLTGLFGQVVAAPPLVLLIGLAGDTNDSHSRRILLLEESIQLTESRRYADLVEIILKRYLFDYKKPGALVPRFLLNDIIRYWHTVAVDYQAKRWEELVAEKWGLRYLKLRTTRKLTYAGTVASLFMPVITGTPTTPEYLAEQFQIPPLARLAQLHGYLGSDEARDGLRRVLELADHFSGRMADQAFRNAANKIMVPRMAPKNSVFYRAEQKADDLQNALGAWCEVADEEDRGPRDSDHRPVLRRTVTR